MFGLITMLLSTLIDGKSSINLDNVSNMTDGTFVALNTNIQCFTTNEDGWDLVKGSVEDNILTIISNNPSCGDTISWLVIGERCDENIKTSPSTDINGKLIPEQLK